MPGRLGFLNFHNVALRKESVDRNNGVHYDNYNLHWSLSARRAWIEMSWLLSVVSHSLVALRKESVDRNAGKAPYMENAVVALRKESVDRNSDGAKELKSLMLSLSARRAWIEMRKYHTADTKKAWSLSARRAWIEIIQ